MYMYKWFWLIFDYIILAHQRLIIGASIVTLKWQFVTVYVGFAQAQPNYCQNALYV